MSKPQASAHSPAPPTPDDFQPRASWGARLAALIFLAALGWMSWAFGSAGLTYVQIARGAPDFVAVQGKITSASLRQESQNHLPDVRFEYEHGGKRYEGTNRHSAESFRDAKLARRELQRYPSGHEVTVYVNPKAPKQATLSREISMAPGLLRLAYGALSLGAMIFSMVVFVRVSKRQRALARSKHMLAQARAQRAASARGADQAEPASP